MKLFEIASIVCRSSLSKWRTNYRVWCIAALLLIFVHMFTKDVGIFAKQLDIQMTPWIFPFLFTQKYIKLLFLFPLVLLFCDAPFIDSSEPYILIRAGRKAWAIGHLLYIVVASGIYFLFLFAASILVNLPQIQYSADWGKVLGTLAKTNASAAIGLGISVDLKIIEYFTPVQAVGFSLLLCWLVGIFMGFLIYFVNATTKNALFGIFAASSLLIWDASITGHNNLYFFSPVSWCTLNNIRIDEKLTQPDIHYVYIAFSILFILLILMILISNRKKSIDVLPPV